MGTIQRMFQLNLKRSEAEMMQRVMALVMIPIFVLQMCSLNLLLTQVAWAEDGTGVIVDTSADKEKIQEDVKDEEVKAGESKREEVKVVNESETNNEESQGEVDETEISDQSVVDDETSADEIEASAEAAKEENGDVSTLVPTSVGTKDVSGDSEEEADGPEWKTDGNKAVIEPVALNVKYTAPQNEDVTVTFTKLPENPGSLEIEEITLSDEQVAQLGALSSKAYDITSSMENGTFEFDLTLPKPDNAENILVKYAKDEADLENAKTIDEDQVNVKEDKVKAENIDHFCVWYIATYSDVDFLVEKDEYQQGETVYAKATVSNNQTLRIVFKDNRGQTAQTCSEETGTSTTCSLVLSETANVGTWSVQVERKYGGNWGKEKSAAFEVIAKNCGYSCPIIPWTWETKEVDVASHYEYADKIVKTEGHWESNWSNGQCYGSPNETCQEQQICPSDNNSYNSHSIKECSRWLSGHWNYANKITQHRHWINATYECPSGYQSNGANCKKWVETTYITTDHSVNVAYEKSNDPNKCHRPSDSDLKDVYGMDNATKDDFKRHNSEWKNSTPVVCQPVDCVGTWTQTSTCSKSCGGGVYQEIFSIVTPAANGGKACSNGNGDLRDGSSICNPEACYVPVCGNDIKDPDEECDDGNRVDNDTCSNSCKLSVCGDGILSISEECDWGAGNDVTCTALYGKSCNYCHPTSCTLGTVIGPKCGDGVINGSEQCDDGNATSGDGCSASCQTEDVTPPTIPTILGFKNPNLSCGAVTNSKYITVDWTDSNDANGIAGYDYQIDYPLASGSGRGVWNAFFTASQYTGSLNEGIHHIKVRAKDSKGNVSDWSNICDITYDSIAPTATINYSTIDLTNKNVVATLVPSESVEVINNNGLAYTFTKNGTFTFEFKDAAGNTGSAIATVNNIDKITPVVSLTAPASGLIKGNVDIRGTVIEEHPFRYWLAIYKGSSEIYSTVVYHSDEFTDRSLYSWDTTKVADGNYQIKFAERDINDSGNRSSDFVVNVTVDNTAPKVPTGIYFRDTVNEKNVSCGGATSARNFDVYWDANAESDFDYYEYISFNADGTTGPVRKFTAPYFNASWWTVPMEGVYGVQIRAVDKIGNKSDWFGGAQGIENSCQYTADWTVPTVDLVFPTPGPSATSFQAVFNEDANKAEAEDPANYFLNNWPGAGGTGNLDSHAAVSYDQSSHTATVTFTTPGWYVSPEQEWGVQNIHDLAGNLQSVTPYSERSTPMVAPETESVPYGTIGTNGWHVSDVTVNLNASDPKIGSGVKATHYSLDNAEFIAGTSVFVNTEGEHTLNFYSEDNAGNVESEKSVSFKIDKNEPESVITYPVNDGDNMIVYSHSWNGVISGTATDVLSGVAGVKLSIQKSGQYWNGASWQTSESEILFDAAGNTSWNYNFPTTQLIEGTYSIKSHAVDVAGNQENTYELTIVFDTTIPEVDLSIQPRHPDGDNKWYVSKPEISLQGDDNFKLDKIEYQIDSDSGSWIEYSDPVEIEDGQHVFYYRALDKAGNVSEIGEKNVSVDTHNPDEVEDIDAKYQNDKQAVKLTWDAKDDDIDEVYIYRGKNKSFKVEHASRISTNNDNDEDYTDYDVQRGEKYYYKFVAFDAAGNKSDVEIISIEIPVAGDNIVVTNEGTEAAPSSLTPEEPTEINGGEEGNKGQVAGVETENLSGENGEGKGGGWAWWWFAIPGALILAIILWLLKRKRVSSNW